MITLAWCEEVFEFDDFFSIFLFFFFLLFISPPFFCLSLFFFVYTYIYIHPFIYLFLFIYYIFILFYWAVYHLYCSCSVVLLMHFFILILLFHLISDLIYYPLFFVSLLIDLSITHTFKGFSQSSNISWRSPFL